MTERVFIRRPSSTELEAGPVEDTIIALDAVVSEDHTSSARKTSNPIELGANVTDHVIIEDSVLVIRGAVTDTPLGLAALGTIIDNVTGLFGSSTSENLTRSQQAYSLLIDIKNERRTIGVQTGLVNYDEMVITNIFVHQDKDSAMIAIMDITLEEANIVASEVINIEPNNLEGETKEKGESELDAGRKSTSPVNGTKKTSLLKSIIG